MEDQHDQADLVSALCSKLDAITEENGKTVLDNTFVMLGGAMHSSNHACNQLPMALIGSGGGIFSTDQHVGLAWRSPKFSRSRRWLSAARAAGGARRC